MSLSEPQVLRRARYAALAIPPVRVALVRPDPAPSRPSSFTLCAWLTCSPCPSVAPDGRVSFARIAADTCAYFGISLERLRGASRYGDLTPPRAVTAYLAVMHTELGSTVIGKLMGRDHSTVLHHIRVVERILADQEAGRPLKKRASQTLLAISAIRTGFFLGEP